VSARGCDHSSIELGLRDLEEFYIFELVKELLNNQGRSNHCTRPHAKIGVGFEG
jgi:hypothetical protein